MFFKFLITSVIGVAFTLSTSPALARIAAKVAVLPFEIYSDESTEYHRDTVAGELSSQIATEEQIAIVDQATIKNLLESGSIHNFNEVTLRRISEKLKAHFLVLGSLTRISENLSMDVYVFNPLGASPFSKDFTEGKELNSLIREMARKISAKVLLIARKYPELQKSEVAAKVTPREVEEVKEERPAEDSQAKEKTAGRLVPKDQIPEDTLVEEVSEDKVEEEEDKEAEVTMLPQAEIEKVAEQPKDIPKKKPIPSLFSSDKPVKITSNTLEADNKRNKATFKGNVVAKQGDMAIFSDVMAVTYESKGGLKRIEALGNVEMTQKDRIATGKKIVFYNPEQKIVMTGSPRIWQGDNLISCEKVTVLLEENKIFFEGKVDSTIFPEGVKERKRESTRQVEAIASPPEPKEGKKVAEEKEEPIPKKKVSLEGIPEKDDIKKFIFEWKHFWESKDFENYMRCYSKEFTSRGMDWLRWKTYKKRLNDKYRHISLSLSDPHIYLKDNLAIVNFKQYYQSDSYSDYGIKSLILKKEHGDWLIFAEQWKQFRELPPTSSRVLKIDKPILNRIKFDFNRSDINPEFFPVLDEVVRIIKAHPEKKVIIEGHTCSIGAKAYNKAMSLRRATSVKKYLINKGINFNRLSVEAYGGERPIADNETLKGRRMNRRVELKVIDDQAIAKHIAPP